MRQARCLTIGMLENSGADSERRHEIKKAGQQCRSTQWFENRSAYLTLRWLLIWQYGRDMLSVMEAEA